MFKKICFILILSVFVTQIGFSQEKDSGTEPVDSVYKTLGKVWFNSLVLPGYGQIYNKDYWKIPISYAGIGTFAYLSYKENMAYKSDTANMRLIPDMYDFYLSSSKEHLYTKKLYNTGLAAVLWATAFDVVLNYDFEGHFPARATVYSAMLPGLGQAYNKMYWKIPLWYTALAGSGWYASYNNSQYQRYLNALRNKVDVGPYIFEEHERQITNMKDYYRRSRDIGYLMFGLVYVLQVLDANVDAHLMDYDISSDLSYKVSPVLFNHRSTYASNTVGLGLTFNF